MGGAADAAPLAAIEHLCQRIEPQMRGWPTPMHCEAQLPRIQARTGSPMARFTASKAALTAAVAVVLSSSVGFGI